MQPFTKGSPRERYEQLRRMELDLDMTRGKPCSEQLDLSDAMLGIRDYIAEDGADCRNYAPPEHLSGLPEARKLFGEYLGVPASNVWMHSNSSLAMMHDLVVQTIMRQLPGENRLWDPHHSLRNRPVMLCPVPGYDRHHIVCETYGIETLSIPLTEEGPDMDAVNAALTGPKRWNIIGMWCIPMYSNPLGITYSNRVCEQLACMRTHKGFRIFWDLAYAEHHLDEPGEKLPNFLELCRLASNPDRPFILGSTSKITFANAGLAFFGASDANLEWFRGSFKAQTIGADRLNQLRHVRFLRDMDGIRAHMRKHAAIIKPKLDVACEVLERELGGKDVAWWRKPHGGYFLPIKFKPGTVTKIIASAAEVGVKLTPAGSTHPDRLDPNNEWMRFAFTFPPTRDVALGAETASVCGLLQAGL